MHTDYIYHMIITEESSQANIKLMTSFFIHFIEQGVVIYNII